MPKKSREILKCPACGFKNSGARKLARCASCGGRLAQAQVQNSSDEFADEVEDGGFHFLWLFIATILMALLTAGIIVGLPRVAPIFDFEGYAGIIMVIPIWTFGGFLVGLLSPPRTFAEPVVAALFVAGPTIVWLFQGQTVKTLPVFMYLLFAALALLFTLVGAYAGDRLQPRSSSATS